LSGKWGLTRTTRQIVTRFKLNDGRFLIKLNSLQLFISYTYHSADVLESAHTAAHSQSLSFGTSQAFNLHSCIHRYHGARGDGAPASTLIEITDTWARLPTAEGVPAIA
jgi:hypothetical protein